MAVKKKHPQTKYPKGIYIYWETDRTDVFPIAVTDLNEIPADYSGEVVGCYNLNSVLRFRVERRLEDV